MGLPDLSLRRPVTIFMVFIGVILLGFISWSRLPQELFPPITYPQITVVTQYKDAAPEEIEILVTKPLEETIGTVNGLKRISSVSKEELSVITAEFDWGTNMDFAALGVREKIDLVKEKLPRGSEEPVVMKYNPFDLPVIVLNVTSDLPQGDALQFTRKIIKNELEKTSGVAVVRLSGGREREILVEVDQGRLQASGVSVVAISDALNKANLNYPAGTVEESFYEYLIRTMGEFKAVSEIKDIVVSVEELPTGREEDAAKKQLAGEDRPTKKRLILLSDTAKVKDTLQEETTLARYNGEDNISLAVIKQAGANTLAAANNVKDTLKKLQENLPPQIKITAAYDQSKFIKASISGVRDAAVQGGLLAFFILWIFLENAAAAMIVALSIPISVMGVFSLMYFSGISLNMISMGGLALGVGMLVDNSIVVLENIFRHRRFGKAPRVAAAFGANEVKPAIIGSTLTTVAVFLPMVFVVGVAGQLFRELAFTVVFSLLVSLMVALSLIPILASRQKTSSGLAGILPAGIAAFLSAAKRRFGRIFSHIKRLVPADKIKGASSWILSFFLGNKFKSMLTVFLFFLLGIFVFMTLDRELLPRVDQGQFVIKVNMSPGTRLRVTDSAVKKIERHLFDFPETKDVTISIGSSKEKIHGPSIETLGSHQAEIMVSLKPLSTHKRTRYRLFQALFRPFSNTDPKRFRTRSTSYVLQELKARLEKEDLKNAEIEYIVQESVFQMAFASSAPVVVEIKGDDLAKLKKISEDAQDGLKKIKGIYSVRTSLVPQAPEAKVYIRKDRAAAYNLSVSDIALTAQTAMKGYVATKFKESGREIDIRVRLREQDRRDINKLRRLIVHSPLEIDVPLAEVAYFAIGKGPSQIRRLSQQRVITVMANVYGRVLKDVMAEIESALGGISDGLPPDYSCTLTGESLQMKESFRGLRFALILSLILVYMIMAAEFESLWQPFIILFTFPLSLIGVAMGLKITNTPISIMVILGLIVLGGIVVNNGIVLIEYINTLRSRDKMKAYQAAVLASKTRLRPIMMTALTTTLGLAPLAVGLSEGAEIQVPMAVTVMAGLLLSTFLSLVVVPTLYLGFDGFLSLQGRLWQNLSKRQPLPQRLLPGPEPKHKKPQGPPPADVIILPEKPPPAEAQPAILLPAEPDAAEERPKEPEGRAEKRPEGPAESRPKAVIHLPGAPAKEAAEYRRHEGPDKRQQDLIEYLKEHKRITRREYASIFGVTKLTASRSLNDMAKKGLIAARGPKAKGRYYELMTNSE